MTFLKESSLWRIFAYKMFFSLVFVAFFSIFQISNNVASMRWHASCEIEWCVYFWVLCNSFFNPYIKIWYVQISTKKVKSDCKKWENFRQKTGSWGQFIENSRWFLIVNSVQKPRKMVVFFQIFFLFKKCFVLNSK